MDDVVAGFSSAGAAVQRGEDDLLTINGEFSISVVVVRCRRTPAGALRWRLRLDTGLQPDITVAVRMDHGNQRPFDYYLFPRIDRLSAAVRLAEDNGLLLDGYRFETLDQLFRLGERELIAEAA
jgi:hypothetical protein